MNALLVILQVLVVYSVGALYFAVIGWSSPMPRSHYLWGIFLWPVILVAYFTVGGGRG